MERNIMENNIYILALQASEIQKQDKIYVVDNNKEFNKIYNGTISDSMDLTYLFNIAKNELKIAPKMHTRVMINVEFSKPYKIATEDIVYKIGTTSRGNISAFTTTKKLMNKNVRQLRKEFYKNGFDVNYGDVTISYVMYKRSSSKSRNGDCLFINKAFYQEMINWSRVGVKFESNSVTDIASLRAYESLTLSGIEDSINIKANEILMIKDIKSPTIRTNASVTQRINGEIVEKSYPEWELNNDIFDGQSLLDESLCDKKGCKLLRNRWFKTCGFNTKIQAWFNDNNVGDVIYDMFGRELKTNEIKIITTPNSLKFMKMMKLTNKFKTEKECYEYWLDTLITEFGVVKSEKSSPFDIEENIYDEDDEIIVEKQQRNQLSYQIINSLPLNKEAIKELCSDEVKYIGQLKNDINVFKSYINSTQIEEDKSLIENLFVVNEKFQDTELFRNYRKKVIDNYTNRLKKGKIKVPNTDYMVIVGNPYEMLQYAIGITDINHIHKGKQVYSSMFIDGEELAGFRNPHILSGNVLYAQNIYNEVFTKYFNFTDNIVITNSLDNDIMDRLQGQDFDSDTLLLSSYELLVKCAKECENFPTPINKITGEENAKLLNSNNMAEIDYIISTNYIGRIINWSQVLNSYYWDFYFEYNGEDKQNILDEIYSEISKLSSFSQVEIDKSKKFINIDMDIELNKLLEKNFLFENKTKLFRRKKLKSDEYDKIVNKEITKYKLISYEKLMLNIDNGYIMNEEEEILSEECKNYYCDIKVSIRPTFFKYIGVDRFVFKCFNCPMDNLILELNSIPAKKNRTKIIDIEDILDNSSMVMNLADRKQIEQKIFPLAIMYKQDINRLYSEGNANKKELSRLKDTFNDNIKKLKIKSETIYAIIIRAYSNKDKYKNKEDRKDINQFKLRLLKALILNHKENVVSCFK